ncbi:PASTA domain-containing protein [Fulvivirga sediminis]|uniref:PASTA domain-containing protein n=1 Tax=Fulvivirga sediminis TaxID=2803949 RepID=A0A937JZU0_9BACT|nr:PASTA domain-containing protein [Fulvivirga sediminis]MBL3655586.1 PASTA domain-containing protein [Fulvivirga sediminis]
MKVQQKSLKDFLIHLVIVAILLLGGTLAFFYMYLPSYTNQGESITVPNLDGISMDEIDDFLTKRNLRYEVNDSTFSEDYPPLTIVKQYPKPGSKVKENRKIFISINRVSPPTVPVPDLVDRSLLNAEAVLKSNELKRGEIIYQPSQFHNLVLDMQMNGEKIEKEDRIPKGSVIDLIVGNGSGTSMFKAPNIVGSELEDATFVILGSNLKIGLIALEGDTTGMKAIVTKQEPFAGSQVNVGDEIDIWISPAETTVE